MSFTAQAETFLKYLRRVPSWDESVYYDSKTRPECVVFHNHHLYGMEIERSVISDIANSGTLAIKATVEGLVDSAMGSEDAKVLVPFGADPCNPKTIVYDRYAWEALDDEARLANLKIAKDLGSPVVLLKGFAESKLPIDDAEIADEIEAIAKPAVRQIGIGRGGEKVYAVGSDELPTPQDGPQTLAQKSIECIDMLDRCLVLMRDHPEFNGAIGYVREARNVCPSIE